LYYTVLNLFIYYIALYYIALNYTSPHITVPYCTVRADEMNMTSRLKRIALGQGQGKKAVAMIERGVVTGDW
jgi:hypothetical protein